MSSLAGTAVSGALINLALPNTPIMIRTPFPTGRSKAVTSTSRSAFRVSKGACQ